MRRAVPPSGANDAVRSADDSARLVWVDAAKGVCIVLVVLHHAVLLLDGQGLVPPALSALDVALASLRMPLFFLVSGLFLDASLARPWRSFLHRRVALFGYLYLLWTVLQFVVLSVLPAGVVPAMAAQDRSQVLWSLVSPAPQLWFLYALTVFSLLAGVLARVPVLLSLAGSAVLSAVVGAGIVPIPSFQWELTARCLFFFLLGWHGRGLVERVAATTGSVRVLLVATIAGLAAAASVVLGLHSVLGVAFVLNLLAVTVGVLGAAQLSRWRIGRVAVRLGRQTLPIYLTNMLVVGVLVAILQGGHLPVPAQYLLVATLVVVAIAAALGVHRVLLAARCGWLYDLPGRWAVGTGARTSARPASNECPSRSR